MEQSVTYVGRDLEAMSFAVNYYRWVWQIFEPYVGKRLVEVGSGTGSFAKLLLGSQPDSLTLIEPSAEMFAKLKTRAAEFSGAAEVRIHHAMFRPLADKIKSETDPDSIIYVNVLEHVEEDEEELRAIHRTLAPGGHLFIFVPALGFLYSDFDKALGHFRRYSKKELEGKVAAAGFRIRELKFFDSLGIIPWWVNFRLLGAGDARPRNVELYDRLAVPLVKKIESIIEPPLGKNLILVAQKA